MTKREQDVREWIRRLREGDQAESRQQADREARKGDLDTGGRAGVAKGVFGLAAVKLDTDEGHDL